MNDSLRTDVCLLYPPYLIALGKLVYFEDLNKHFSFSFPFHNKNMSMLYTDFSKAVKNENFQLKF